LIKDFSNQASIEMKNIIDRVKKNPVFAIGCLCALLSATNRAEGMYTDQLNAQIMGNLMSNGVTLVPKKDLPKELTDDEVMRAKELVVKVFDEISMEFLDILIEDSNQRMIKLFGSIECINEALFNGPNNMRSKTSLGIVQLRSEEAHSISGLVSWKGCSVFTCKHRESLASFVCNAKRRHIKYCRLADESFEEIPLIDSEVLSQKMYAEVSELNEILEGRALIDGLHEMKYVTGPTIMSMFCKALNETGVTLVVKE
jgi:hypothetical protein